MNNCENPMGLLFCPKPRRLGPLRFLLSNDFEPFDSGAGLGLLDLIIKKEDFDSEHSATQVSSPPPFCFGTPPGRALNPLVRDARFREDMLTSGRPSPSTSTSPSSGQVGVSERIVGSKQPLVRVDGFDCKSSRVAAMA